MDLPAQHIRRQHHQLEQSLDENRSALLDQRLTLKPRDPRTAKSVMELDMDDLLGRVDLIDRRIAREEREQNAREQQEPMSADKRRHKHIISPHCTQTHQPNSAPSAERHPLHDHQRQVSERPERERQPPEGIPRRYIQTRSGMFIHAEATWEEERVNGYSLAREASESSFSQAPAGAPKDPPPSYSEAAQQTQSTEPSKALEPVVKKKKKQQIRAKKYEGALRFLAGRKELGGL